MKIIKEPTTTLFPVPAVLVSVKYAKKNNIIAIAWTGTVCSKPAMLSISVRPSRFSHHLIKESGNFVVNIPTSELVKKVDLCGMTSGKDIDKFEKHGFTPVPATKVQSPLIDECPVNIECVTKQFIELGAHDLFIAEIVAIHVSEDILSDGKIDFDKIETFAYMNGEYRAISKKIGSYGFSIK